MQFDGVAAPTTPRIVSIGNVLWMTYADVSSNATARTVVGKSCDGGRSWGSVMPVNVADATVDPVLRPFLLRSETQAILAGQRPDGVKDALALVTKTLE